MRPKVCILTYGKLSDMLREEVHNFQQSTNGADFQIYEILMDPAIPLPDVIADADVYVSSGYNAHILQEKVDKPIVVMQTSLSDILICIQEAARYDPHPLVLSFGEPDPLLRRLKDQIVCEPILESFQVPRDLPEIIRRHRERGGRCVVGTALACMYAEQQNLRSVYMHPRESVKTYLQLAVDTAVSLHREVSKSRQLSAIIEHSNTGLLLTNSDGYITVCNPTATMFLSACKEHLLGKHIYEVFTQEELGDIHGLKYNCLNQICIIDGTRFVVNLIPILVKNELSSLLITFTDAANIRKAERHIARNIRDRGFIAKHHFEEYRSQSVKFQNLIKKARRFSQLEEIVVIHGETGTGKEVLAQSIHNNSSRAGAPFVPINCSALSETLLESELFGYDEGAFTGAKKGGKEGVFEMARHGTIFLDEIGEISPSIQAKLLRVIQEKQIMRVGGTKLVPIDARIITATNKNLWELVQSGAFREDLYYRINVLELYIPPLRERPEDIMPLFFQFLHRHDHVSSYQLERQSAELNTLLCSYHWPGNIRELENFVLMLCAVLFPDSNTEQALTAVAEMIQDRLHKHLYAEPEPANESTDMDVEQAALLHTIEKYGGNRTLAAKSLGISRVTLWRKLKKSQSSS